MDLIAGLPKDTLESFKNTVDGVIKLGAENITVHTLSVKRAADLRDEGEKVHENSDALASPMVDYAQEKLVDNGYLPYYLYRQKNMLESLENVGYAKNGFKGLYNVYIMDEIHTILSAGAGGVTKLKDNETDKIVRIFNLRFPYEYISRYDEIIKRKERIYNFFLPKK
jgi:oxygen-independent coproporphyrinogen-3 oxidase